MPKIGFQNFPVKIFTNSAQKFHPKMIALRVRACVCAYILRLCACWFNALMCLWLLCVYARLCFATCFAFCDLVHFSLTTDRLCFALSNLCSCFLGFVVASLFSLVFGGASWWLCDMSLARKKKERRLLSALNQKIKISTYKSEIL